MSAGSIRSCANGVRRHVSLRAPPFYHFISILPFLPSVTVRRAAVQTESNVPGRGENGKTQEQKSFFCH